MTTYQKGLRVIEEIKDGSSQTGGRTVDEAENIISKGHPPIAEGIILVDFDGTVAPFGYLFDFPEPYADMVKFIRDHTAKGYKIVIFTSRLSGKWLKSVGQTKQQHVEYITDYCRKYNIPISGITAEKVPSVAYIDDKAYHYEPGANSFSLEFEALV